MTVLGLIADTQGRFDVAALLGFLRDVFRDVDEIWHAGDWSDAAVLEGLAALKPLTVVNGNAPDDPRYPLRVERTIGPLRVGMIHNLTRAELAWASRFDLCIHAHTHRWRDETVGPTRFINPGTATRPQFGGTERTIAILRLRQTADLQKIFVPPFPIGVA